MAPLDRKPRARRQLWAEGRSCSPRNRTARRREPGARPGRAGRKGPRALHCAQGSSPSGEFVWCLGVRSGAPGLWLWSECTGRAVTAWAGPTSVGRGWPGPRGVSTTTSREAPEASPCFSRPLSGGTRTRGTVSLASESSSLPP